MRALVVVAHPDDEVLGCGGTLARLAAAGVEANACILCGDVDIRVNRPEIPALRQDTAQAQDILGIGSPIVGELPNIRLNTVPHVELVQFIERAIEGTGADTLFTHHPGDLNDDHLQTSRACQAAARLFQRRAGVPELKALYYMEVPSATDWALTPSPRFQPDTYVEIGEDGLDRKLRALEAYQGIMRPFPHPRSHEVLRGLAACRGAEARLLYAEAFETAFSRLSIP